MSLSNSALQKVQNLAQSIIDLITNHENIEASSTQKGHVKLSDSTSTTNSKIAATLTAVKAAYDKGNHSHPYISTTAGSVGTNNLADKSIITAKVADVEYVEGTHGTIATGSWTGTCTKLKNVEKGSRIYFKMTSAGSDNASLTLTLADGSTFGPKDVYYNANTRFTTHLPINTVLNLVYNGTQWVNTAIQNTNYFDRIYTVSRIINGESSTINKYTLIWGKTDKKYYKIASNSTFNIRYPILWLGTDLKSGDFTSNVYILHSAVNLQNTISNKTVDNNQQIYVEGTAFNNGDFTISDNVFVSEGSLTNGRYYLPIGMSYSTTNIRLNVTNQQVYYYDGTNLKPVEDFKYSASNHNHDGVYLKTHQDISEKENISNKSSSITTDTGSTTKYPTVKAVEDYAAAGNHTHSYAPSSHTSVTANSTTLGHVKAGTNVGAADTANGSAGTTTSGLFAPADHVHKQSNLYATSEHTHDYSKVSVSQTKTSGIEIGKVTIDGVSTPLYQQDNNTTYTAASATPIADTSSGAVGTSAKYARQDHSHPQSTLYAESTHTHNEYAELIHNHTLSDISDSIEYYSGANMLKGTRLFTAPDLCPSESTINGTYYDCNVRYMQNTSSTSHLTYEYYIPYSNIVNGEYYTLSFWAKATTAHDFIQTYWYLANNNITKRIASNSTYTGQNGESDSFSDGQTRFAITTNWKRYYVVYQTNPNPSNTSSDRRLLIRLNKNNNQKDLYLAGVKFERGNKPTPYNENMMDYVGDAITYINQ